jgi:DNA-directed RNA polymerase I, II, and III subunit RPABC2
MSHNIKKKPILDSEKDTEDDNKSQSTDSDIVSGSFSQLDDNDEEIAEDDDKTNSDIDEEEAEEEIEVEAEAEEAEAEEEIGEDEEVEKTKDKKKKIAKKQLGITNDCLYNNIDFEEDYEEKEVKVENNKRISINRLTKYERVRIIGIRAKQIITGANILIKGIENKTPTEIAELELKYNMIPFKIKRKLPNGMYEIWKLSELEK